MNNLDDIPVTKTEAAKFFGVSTRTLSDWITTGGCPVHKRDSAGRVKQVSLPAIYCWRFEAEHHVDLGEISVQLLKMEMLNLAIRFSQALPHVVKSSVEKSSDDSAEYGAKCAFTLLHFLICEQFGLDLEDENTGIPVEIPKW